MAASQEVVPSSKPAKHHRLLGIIGRIVLILFGLAFPCVMIEIFMRVGFDYLPPAVQGDIQHVQRVPWSSDTIIPAIPFLIEKQFQTRLPVGLKDYPVHWSDAKFTFSTISAWDGHRAGLRSDPPVYPLDIMAFGDSFTFCWTAWQDCWVNKLHTDDHWKVFDAAIPATGTLGQEALMSELVGPMKPSLVVWAWYNNDVTDDYDLAHLRGDTGDLQGGIYPDPVRDPAGFAKISALYDLYYNAAHPQPKTTPYLHYKEITVDGFSMLMHTNEYPYPDNPQYPATQYGWTRNVQAHDDGAKLIQGIGAKMLIVIIPAKEEAYADGLTPILGKPYLDVEGQTRQMLLSLCAERGWDCLDATPAFQQAVKAGKRVFYDYDSHLDPSGNTVLAQIVRDYIVDHHMLPAK